MITLKEMITPIPYQIKEDTTLEEALNIMKEEKYGLLPVVNEDGKLMGVFTRSKLFQMVKQEKPLITSIKDFVKKDVYSLKENTPYKELEEIVRNSSVGTGVVVDAENRVLGLFTKADMVMGLLNVTRTLNLKQSLQTALDHAYDGILLADETQTIQMVSPSLLELFNMGFEDVLHKKTDAVFPHFQLSKIYETEEAEVSDFHEINGIKYIIHRIPVLQEGRMVGAIVKIMYRQLNEVNDLFKRLQKAESKASFYHTELKKSENARFTWDHIISEHPVMEKIKKSAAKAAKGRSTILIRGESGTGKELFAHAAHNSSARKDGKFVVVNCAAIPEDLLESEFFGYEDGAFTGARSRGKIGKFDLANGGSLFLDEIGDMSLNLQAKLLRVLQEREFYRVGGTKRIQVDVRIIAATNRHLEEMVKEGTFREDLYYRLNVISLFIPPLRERMMDIQILSDRIMSELNRVIGTSITGFEPRAKQILMSYHWPGNVRELRNVMERAMTFAEHGKIKVEDLPDYMLGSNHVLVDETAVTQEESMVESAERVAIETALTKTKGNKAKAAKMLGISRSSLYDKLRKYQLNEK
ncbi:sigma 54-interacting transcriptional regulator [Sutcliffiella horikoshii]|uniref:Sigma-54-dependent Fis family transcriptional regulator n=1 Tax=Sutcliffiella horikoshii TaxID=79883 RepID=A0AA94WXF1_9BACI|nr:MULTISPECIES: sigma-54-dependent Fis family transcriptional regulator [Bacillaceae]TYS61336.1 sigma-54-dependent Fis family transcriptional regulator [Sutcliffiella horikoshii]